MRATKEKCEMFPYTLYSEVIEDHKYSDNLISMLLNQKAKQSRKLHPTSIYLENCSTYKHMYNEDILVYVWEGNRWVFVYFNEGNTFANKKLCFGSIECWLKN